MRVRAISSSALLAANLMCGRRPPRSVLLSSRSTANYCSEDAELPTHGPRSYAPAAELALFALLLYLCASATGQRHASSCGGRGAGIGLVALFGENPRKNPHAQAN